MVVVTFSPPIARHDHHLRVVDRSGRSAPARRASSRSRGSSRRPCARRRRCACPARAAAAPRAASPMRSISLRSAPKTLMPTGVRTPVVSMSMRVLIGMVQALVMPGSCSASFISSIELLRGDVVAARCGGSTGCQPLRRPVASTSVVLAATARAASGRRPSPSSRTAPGRWTSRRGRPCRTRARPPGNC